MTEPRGGGLRPGQRGDHGERYEVVIEVDGRPVPLKVFLHDLIGGAAVGLLSGLRGVDDPDHVRIEVRRR
jgi:hypothetical protein